MCGCVKKADTLNALFEAFTNRACSVIIQIKQNQTKSELPTRSPQLLPHQNSSVRVQW